MRWIMVCAALFVNSFALAQAQDGASDVTGANVGYEAGILLGNLLPNQIPGLTEVTGMGGVQAGYRISSVSFFESRFIVGNGHGANWKNLELSVRFDIPIESLVALVYLGGDAVNYTGVGQGDRIVFGGHLGGGVMSLLGGNTWFRADMKFASSPGTSLFIGFALLFRFSGGQGS